MHALVLSADGLTVENSIVVDDGIDLSLFGAVEAPGTNIGIGWVLSGATWVPPAPPETPPPSKAELIEYVQQKKSHLLSVGINVTISPSLSIECDGTPATETNLTGKFLWGTANPTATSTWWDNEWVAHTLTGEEFVTFAGDVLNWINRLYDFAGPLIAQINAGAITAFAELDAHSWPTA